MNSENAELLRRLDAWDGSSDPGEGNSSDPGPLIRWAAAHVRGCGQATIAAWDGLGAGEGTARSTVTAQAGSPGSPSAPSTASAAASEFAATPDLKPTPSSSDSDVVTDQGDRQPRGLSAITCTDGCVAIRAVSDPRPSRVTRATSGSTSTPSSEASSSAGSDPAMSDDSSTSSKPKDSAPAPSSGSSRRSASHSEPLSATELYPTTQPTSGSYRVLNELLSSRLDELMRTRSPQQLVELGLAQSSDFSWVPASDLEKPSDSTRGTSSSTKGLSESESPRPGCVPSRSATTPLPLSVMSWPVLQDDQRNFLCFGHHAAEVFDFEAPPSAMPFLEFFLLGVCPLCHHMLYGTAQPHSCSLTDTRCGSSPSSWVTGILPLRVVSTPTSSPKRRGLLSALWTALRGDRVPDRVPNEANPCSGTSDCGSEGYGFKPRRPPQSKHESPGQRGSGSAPMGQDRVPDRVPA